MSHTNLNKLKEFNERFVTNLHVKIKEHIGNDAKKNIRYNEKGGEMEWSRILYY